MRSLVVEGLQVALVLVVDREDRVKRELAEAEEYVKGEKKYAEKYAEEEEVLTGEMVDAVAGSFSGT